MTRQEFAQLAHDRRAQRSGKVAIETEVAVKTAYFAVCGSYGRLYWLRIAEYARSRRDVAAHRAALAQSRAVPPLSSLGI